MLTTEDNNIISSIPIFPHPIQIPSHHLRHFIRMTTFNQWLFVLSHPLLLNPSIAHQVPLLNAYPSSISHHFHAKVFIYFVRYFWFSNPVLSLSSLRLFCSLFANEEHFLFNSTGIQMLFVCQINRFFLSMDSSLFIALYPSLHVYSYLYNPPYQCSLFPFHPVNQRPIKVSRYSSPWKSTEPNWDNMKTPECQRNREGRESV